MGNSLNELEADVRLYNSGTVGQIHYPGSFHISLTIKKGSITWQSSQLRSFNEFIKKGKKENKLRNKQKRRRTPK